MILNITSTDVLHSWWVPALGGQVQATPGDVVQTWFKADEVGRYARPLDDLLRHQLPGDAGLGPGASRCPSTRPTSSSCRRTSTAAQGDHLEDQKASGAAAPAEGGQ